MRQLLAMRRSLNDSDQTRQLHSKKASRLLSSFTPSLQFSGVAPTQPVLQGTITGVEVKSIEPRGAMHVAGVRVGDIITAVNGVACKTPAVLDRVVAGLKPGMSIPVTVLRYEHRHAKIGSVSSSATSSSSTSSSSAIIGSDQRLDGDNTDHTSQAADRDMEFPTLSPSPSLPPAGLLDGPIKLMIAVTVGAQNVILEELLAIVRLATPAPSMSEMSVLQHLLTRHKQSKGGSGAGKGSVPTSINDRIDMSDDDDDDVEEVGIGATAPKDMTAGKNHRKVEELAL